MKESAADKLSRAYRMGADDAQKQARQELEELRDLCDNQARIIESMQKQAQKINDFVEDMKLSGKLAQVSKRRAPRDASRNFSEDESDVEQLSKQGR
jgi:hypothetical protein